MKVSIAIIFFLFTSFFVNVADAETDEFSANNADGSIRVTGVDSWDGARTYSSGFQKADGPASAYNAATSNIYIDNTFYIGRAYIPFDTSGIPDDAVIESAILRVYPVDRFMSEFDEHSYIQPVGPVNTESLVMSLGDYDQLGFVNNPVKFSDSKITYQDAWPLNTYVEFPLNQEGLDAISKSNFSKFAIRTGHDIENVAPDSPSPQGNQWIFYSADFPNSTKHPKLIVNYSLQTNEAPIFEGIEDLVLNEGVPFGINLTAADLDNDTLTYSASGLPSGAVLNPATGEFSWTPTYSQAGTYGITFTVTDDGDPALSDTETVTIAVQNTNRAPILSSIGNQTVPEGGTLIFTVSAEDSDGDSLTYSATNLPVGASFNSGTQTFTWTPSYNQSGNYENIEFSVSDSGSPMEVDVELITITVGDVNRAPELSNPGPHEVLEASLLSFPISAIDPDGDIVSITATALPSGSSFNGDTFTWTPTLSQEGVYAVTFTATDNGTPNESSIVEVVITVGDNPTPTEQAEDLIEDVVELELPQNVENSYLANLQKVEQFILDGKIQAAINQLEAFIHKMSQDYQQGRLTLEERNNLITAAESIIEDLGG